MKKGRATQVQAIFISDNPLLAQGIDVANMTDTERETWEALQDAISAVQQDNPAADIYLLTMNRYTGTQIVQIERWGVAQYPAIRLWAKYADDSEAYYLFDPLIPGMAPPLDKVAPALSALYKGEFGGASLLCNLFPPLCRLSAFAWLGIAAFSAYRATQAQGAARLAWGAGAALAGNEFLQRGGIKNFESITAGAQQPNSLTP